jgi:hypothetical protein
VKLFYLGVLIGLIIALPAFWFSCWLCTKTMELITPIPKPTIKTFMKIMAKDVPVKEEGYLEH